MAYGSIKRISEDAPGFFSGSLEDLEKVGNVLKFEKQTGLEDVNRLDVVDYTDLGGGIADKLIPNLKVNQKNLATASPEVQDAVSTLVKAAAKDKNDLNITIRKF